MTARPIHAGLRAVLEFGPTVGFVIAYLVFRNDAVVVAGTQYSGLVMVLAAFLPIFALAIGVLWFLTRRIARLQVATAVLVLVFGGLSVWLNDPVFFKMKPTAIYLTLALILGVGLVRGQSWLSYIMEDMIPLRSAGWMLLTKRVVALFVLSAAANELVWRTQSEGFWLIFEAVVMPIVVVAFFVLQIGLVVEYATFKSGSKAGKKKHRNKG